MYIEATCILKGDDKLTNQSFANWLNTVLLPECFMRDGGLFSDSPTPPLSAKHLLVLTSPVTQVAFTRTSMRFPLGH